VAEDQRHLIASNAKSLAQAAANPGCVPLGICWGSILGGFVMYEPRANGVLLLHRLMVDYRVQRRGIARETMLLLLERFLTENFETIYLSFRPENIAARSLYDRLGFVEQEIEVDGEVLYRLGPPREIPPPDAPV
jgi:diamine N-acetyltransferase